MKSFKIILFVLSAIVFVLVAFECVRFQNLIHPNKPYTATLSMDNYRTQQENYVTLDEIKNNTALISIEGNGSKLFSEGEKYTLDGMGNAILGPSFKGNIEILSLSENEVKVYVDINRTTSFYIFFGMMGLILSSIFSFLFFHLLYQPARGISWLSNYIKNRQIKTV